MSQDIVDCLEAVARPLSDSFVEALRFRELGHKRGDGVTLELSGKLMKSLSLGCDDRHLLTDVLLIRAGRRGATARSSATSRDQRPTSKHHAEHDEHDEHEASATGEPQASAAPPRSDGRCSDCGRGRPLRHRLLCLHAGIHRSDPASKLSERARVRGDDAAQFGATRRNIREQLRVGSRIASSLQFPVLPCATHATDSTYAARKRGDQPSRAHDNCILREDRILFTSATPSVSFPVARRGSASNAHLRNDERTADCFENH